MRAALSTCLLALVLGAGLAACSTMPERIAAGTDRAANGNLAAGERFGARIGAPAEGIETALRAQGYGFEGVTACSGETRALFGCAAGDAYLQFQPLAMDRKGHVYLKIENGRVSAIGWDLKTVAFSEG